MGKRGRSTNRRGVTQYQIPFGKTRRVNSKRNSRVASLVHIRPRKGITKIPLSVAVVLLFVLGVVGIGVLLLAKNVRLETHAKDIAAAFIGQHTPDLWLVTREPTTEAELIAQIPITESFREKLEYCLNAFPQDDSIAALRQAFSGRFLVTYLTPAGGTRSTGDSDRMHNLMRDPRTLEVVLYGSHVRHIPRVKSRGQTPFFYDVEWRAIVIPAVTVVEPWFCALTLHEMHHAQLHRVVHVASATAPFLSDVWIREELDAHNLETRVLNHWTKKEYGARIQKIIAHRRLTSLNELLGRLAIDDLEQLNQLFPPARETEAVFRTTQYILDLAVNLLDARKQPLQEKVTAYRTIFGGFVPASAQK